MLENGITPLLHHWLWRYN